MALPTNIEKILNQDIVEGVRVELKEGWNPQSILHTICAFANDIDNFYGGYIIIGISDDRKVLGFEKKSFDSLQKDIFRYCKKCMEPTYIPVIDMVEYQGKDVVVLWCPAGDDRPYQCYEDVYKEKKETKYITYIRKGSMTIAASRMDERELFEMKNFIPFDDRVNYNYKIEVIQREIVREYLKEAKSNLLTNFDQQTTEELLSDLKAIGGPKEDLRPKNIALLMFTNKPSDFIPYSNIELTIFRSLDGSEMIEKVFDSPLFQQYKDCMEYISTNIIQKKILKEEGIYKSTTIFNYSYEVLEEVIANAILHKSYQKPEPVTIRVEPDKIEVTSVPGFDRTISDTAIKELKPKSKRYQSRRIAEFLKELGIVEAKNTGYPRIVKMSEENKSPLPIIEMNPERDYVTVIIPIHPAFSSLDLSIKEKIINALNEKAMTKTELSKFLGYKRVVNSVTYQLEKLIREGYVIQQGKQYQLK